MHCARQSNRAGLSPIAMSPAWLLTRKGSINHAERHRGRSACELMGWLNCEARGPTRGTTALASQSRKGVKSRKPTRSNRYWGRGGFRVNLMVLLWLCLLPELRSELIAHILKLKESDVDYARYALRWYHEKMPWLALMDGVRDALKGQQ